MRQVVEIRCPVGPRKLLSKLILENKKPHITNDNLIEFACFDCCRAARRKHPEVVRVLHRYNLVGELVESEEVYPGD